MKEIINSLHENGFSVAMDDFGSGYSSLNVLKDIELDVIKLDMMFMSEHSESKKGGTILSSIVRMAKWLGLPVIAEGVETIESCGFAVDSAYETNRLKSICYRNNRTADS